MRTEATAVDSEMEGVAKRLGTAPVGYGYAITRKALRDMGWTGQLTALPKPECAHVMWIDTETNNIRVNRLPDGKDMGWLIGLIDKYSGD